MTNKESSNASHDQPIQHITPRYDTQDSQDFIHEVDDDSGLQYENAAVPIDFSQVPEGTN